MPQDHPVTPNGHNDAVAEQLFAELDTAAAGIAALRGQLHMGDQCEVSGATARIRAALDAIERVAAHGASPVTPPGTPPKDAEEANEELMAVVQHALGEDQEAVGQFKEFARGLAKGQVSPGRFVRKTTRVFGEEAAGRLLPAVASLLAATKPEKSRALLEAMDPAHLPGTAAEEDREPRGPLRFPRAMDQGSPQLSESLSSLYPEDATELPTEITQKCPLVHLVLCVHGIGPHKDFTQGDAEDEGGGAAI